MEEIFRNGFLDKPAVKHKESTSVKREDVDLLVSILEPHSRHVSSHRANCRCMNWILLGLRQKSYWWRRMVISNVYYKHGSSRQCSRCPCCPTNMRYMHSLVSLSTDDPPCHA